MIFVFDESLGPDAAVEIAVAAQMASLRSGKIWLASTTL